MITAKPSPELITARGAWEDARTERQQILDVLETAKSEYRQLAASHASAEANLSSVEASAAIKGDAPSFAAARKSFITSRDSLDFAMARCRGLEGTLVIADERLEAARLALWAAWESWKTEVVASLDLEYAMAVQRLIDVADTCLGIGTTLNIGRVLVALRKLTVPSDIAGRGPLISRAGAFRRVWEKSPHAAALSREFLALRREALGGVESSSQEQSEEVEIGVG